VEEAPLKDKGNGNAEEGKRWQTNSNAEATVTNPITPPSTREPSATQINPSFYSSAPNPRITRAPKQEDRPRQSSRSFRCSQIYPRAQSPHSRGHI